jgi:hypothetical protein
MDETSSSQIVNEDLRFPANCWAADMKFPLDTRTDVLLYWRQPEHLFSQQMTYQSGNLNKIAQHWAR